MKITKSGIVTSGGFSNIAPIQDMETKTLSDGSAWARILHHNNKSGTVFFTSSNVMNIQSTDLYSRLYLLESFRDASGVFEFMVIQPEISSTIYRWKQSNNPTNTTTLTGYVNVSNGEGGLVKCSGNTLCAVSTSTSNWWCAVGCYTAYNGGIPGFGRNTVTKSLDFYVRIDTLPKQTIAKTFKNFITSGDFLEL